jgi:isocitrate dehydrogenase
MTTSSAPASAIDPASSRAVPSRTPVAVAAGDGIGPEILAATRKVLDAAVAPLDYHEIVVGEQAYLRGVTSGVPNEAWDVLRRTGVLLKGPITTPKGSGWKSVNVTLRKTLGLFANVRPCVSYAPFVPGPAGMDVVVVRENEEDLYAGIEHRQTQEVWQCLKIVSRGGCERIARYAFAYARAHGRKKVTSVAKDNIMKLTDGLFASACAAVAKEYPEIAYDHQIVDIGTARIASRPRDYDVIVTMNLYGDILSDVAAEVAGSIGLAPSANIGVRAAMFEAIHGSAPDIAGKDLANPSGLLLSAVQMLVHLGHAAVAGRIHDAWLRTIEDGVHTADVFRAGHSVRKVGTMAFADAVCERLGRKPERLPAATCTAAPPLEIPKSIPAPPPQRKDLVGVDVFVQSNETPDALAARLQPLGGGRLKLAMVTNRGVKVWPDGHPETHCTDHWRCRFQRSGAEPLDFEAVLSLLAAAHRAGAEVVKTEHLYEFDGQPGYSMGQGQ